MDEVNKLVEDCMALGKAMEQFVPRITSKRLRAKAHSRIHNLIATGKLQPPNKLRCVGCGHIGSDRKHEYHHSVGYYEKNAEIVEPLCNRCHYIKHHRNYKIQWCSVCGFNVRRPGQRTCKLCHADDMRRRREEAERRKFLARR